MKERGEEEEHIPHQETYHYLINTEFRTLKIGLQYV